MALRIICTLLIFSAVISHAQVGINTTTPSPAAILHIEAENSDGSYGGMIIPTITPGELVDLSLDENSDGLLIFLKDGSTTCLQVYNSATAIFDIINCSGNATELLITEYAEGIANGEKHIEIFNPTASSIDLSQYKIIQLRDGGTLPVDGSDEEYILSGSLGPGQAYVISDNGSVLFTGADLVVTTLNFSGDDPILLTDLSNNIIDVIGIPGTDPGNGYAVDGADTQNVVMRRNKNIIQPSSTWIPSQWSVYPVDLLANLGLR